MCENNGASFSQNWKPNSIKGKSNVKFHIVSSISFCFLWLTADIWVSLMVLFGLRNRVVLGPVYYFENDGNQCWSYLSIECFGKCFAEFVEWLILFHFPVSIFSLRGFLFLMGSNGFIRVEK